MTRLWPRLLVCLLAASNLSLSWQIPEEILEDDDLRLEEEYSEHPALHTVDNQSQSFLRWHCFDQHDFDQLDCHNEMGNEPSTVEDGYDGHAYNALVVFQSNDRTLFFELGYRLDAERCLERKEMVRNLLNASRAVCLYAAEWPSSDSSDFDDQKSTSHYFVAYGIRTENGLYLAPVFED